MAGPLIQLRHVAFKPSDSARSILDNITLDIPRGQITTLIGPNGAGKSTLIELILGLQKPTQGHIHIEGKPSIAYIPQKINMSPLLPLSVKAFMSLETQSSTAASTLHETLALFGVCYTLEQSFHSLSGGERQRVMMARALLKKPDLLVLDEPTQGLDIMNLSHFYKTLAGIHQQLGLTILMVSHDLTWVMASAHHVICLNGHICCAGTPQNVTQDPAYRQLFGHTPVPEGLAPYIHHHDHTHGPGCNHG